MLRETPRPPPCAAGEADCLIGSRWLPGAVLHQSQTKLRRLFSRGFHTIVGALFWMGIKDTQCPAKVVRREAVGKILESLRIADLAFDVNLQNKIAACNTQLGFQR